MSSHCKVCRCTDAMQLMDKRAAMHLLRPHGGSISGCDGFASHQGCVVLSPLHLQRLCLREQILVGCTPTSECMERCIVQGCTKNTWQMRPCDNSS